jgi:excisionase family DNA binding protein
MQTRDKYLTIDEAANDLKSSRRFVYQQIEDGNLSLFKVGRKSYVKEVEVSQLFKKVAVCRAKSN